MPMPLVQIAGLILATAAISDLCWRRIPNILALARAVLLLLVIAWTRNWIGGGDVKLAAAAVLLIGYRRVPDFLVLTALLGGGIALLTLADIYVDRFYGRSLGFAFPVSARRAEGFGSDKP